jgi:hypothetical protein
MTDQSFQSSVAASSADALGVSLAEINNPTMSSVAGRRLQTLSPLGRRLQTSSVMKLAYSITPSSPVDQTAKMEATQASQYISVFGQNLITLEKARAQGFQIASVKSIRISVGTGSPLSNMTSLGADLSIYGSLGWSQAQLLAWATSAAPALEAALIRSFTSTPPVPANQQAVSVKVGNIVIGTSYVTVPFVLFARVPRSGAATAAAYDARAQQYRADMDGLALSAPFSIAFANELTARSVPQLPGQSFAPGGVASTGSDVKAAGGSFAIVIIMTLSFVLLFLMLGIIAIYKNPGLRRRFLPCCPGPASPALVEPREHPGDDIVKPFQDQQGPGSRLKSALSAFDEEEDGPVNFLDLVGLGGTPGPPGLKGRTPRSSRRTPKSVRRKSLDVSNEDSPFQLRSPPMTGHRLNDLEDEATSNLRFAMGSMRSLHTAKLLGSPSHVSPASTRATGETSAKDVMSPVWTTPSPERFGISRDITDLDDVLHLMSMPTKSANQTTATANTTGSTMQSDSDVSIETVVSESETSTSSDDW